MGNPNLYDFSLLSFIVRFVFPFVCSFLVCSIIFQTLVPVDAIRPIRKSYKFEPSSRFVSRLKILYFTFGSEKSIWTCPKIELQELDKVTAIRPTNSRNNKKTLRRHPKDFWHRWFPNFLIFFSKKFSKHLKRNFEQTLNDCGTTSERPQTTPERSPNEPVWTPNDPQLLRNLLGSAFYYFSFVGKNAFS